MAKFFLGCLMLMGFFVVTAVPAAAQTGGIDCDGDGVREPGAAFDTGSGISNCGGSIARRFVEAFFPYLLLGGAPCGVWLLVRWLVRRARGCSGVFLI